MNNIFTASDGQPRCPWCSATPEYIDYHDKEWGFPVSDDQHLFEKLCLESFQSGLSWRTILGKRENFRAAFLKFDFRKLAEFNEQDIERLLQDASIVRHRGKIEATINNAQRMLELIEQESSFAAYVWSFEAKNTGIEKPQTVSTTPESISLSKDLKKRGWKFVGPTTVYAFMQAMGMVNDHSQNCYVFEQVKQARQAFSRPD